MRRHVLFAWLVSVLLPGLAWGSGPGLGNLSYNASELFKPVSWINRDNGIPSTYPFRKAFGTNVGIMHNGYFLTLFAPDSGWGPGGFLLYDVSDPRNIKLVKRIYEPNGRTSEFREAHAIGATNLNGRRYITIQTTSGIEFWDFTDIDNIQQVSKLSLPGVNAGDYTSVAWQLWWQAPYVYVAVANQGIYIVDATDPATPRIADRGGNRPNPVPPAELGGFRVGPIFTMGNQLVISSMDQQDGFASLDISDPLNPLLLDKTPDLSQTYYATCFDGEKVVASVRGSGARMVTYNLDDPARFVLENNSLVIDEQLYCSMQDDYVFQGTEESVHKVDISNTGAYRDVGSGSLNVSNADHGQVFPFGNLVFIGNDHGTGNAFMVHDLDPDTTAPVIRQVSPRHQADNHAITSRIGIGFSDSIDLETVNSDTFIVQTLDGTPVNGRYSAQLGIVNFAPEQALAPNTTYEVIIPAGGIRDYAGNAVEQTFRSTFTTGQENDRGLIYHWTFDGHLNDVWSGNTGSLSGTVNYENGGIRLSSQQSIRTDVALSNVLGGTGTVSLYLKTSQNGNNNPWQAPGLMGRDQNGGTGDVFWGWIDGNGRLRLSAGNDAGVATASAINDGQWHHVVMTRDAGNGSVKIYVDGELSGHGSARSGIFGGGYSFDTIGQISGNSAKLAGSLDDLKVYNRVLSAEEVRALAGRMVVSLDKSIASDAVETGDATVITATGRGSNLQYRWDLGDGTIVDSGDNASVSHTWTTPGHYQVILTVTDGNSSYSTSFVKTVTRPLTPVQSVNSGPITRDGNKVYNINPDNGTVTAIDAFSHGKAWEVRVGKHPRSIAALPDGRLWVTVEGEDRLVALDSSGRLVENIYLPYGSRPYAIVGSPDGSSLYATLQGTNELVRFDTASGIITGRVAVNQDPRAIAIAGNGEQIYVTRFRSAMTNGEVTEVSTASMSITRRIPLAVDTTTVDAEDRSRGIPNYLHSVVISPDGYRLWVPSKKDNIVRGAYRDGQALTQDSSVRTIVTRIDPVTGKELFEEQIDFNDRDSARAVAFTAMGDYAFIALQGSNSVEIIDAYNSASRGAIDNSGLAPQGVVVGPDNKTLFVYNFTSRTVSVYDITDVIESTGFAPVKLAEIKTVGSEKLTAQVLQGKQIFYNARDQRMSRDGYISCASCHDDGGEDGIVWDFTDRGEGLRNTISLRGRMGDAHGNVHWTANFDEIQDFENDIRNAFGGSGFLSDAEFAATANPLGAPKAGRNAELDALAAYVASLEEYPRSGQRKASGGLTDDALLGKLVFDTLNCASCHSGPIFTDGQRHDVGTIQPSSGQGIGQPLVGVGFETPTLLGVHNTAPYFHNGQAETLLDVFRSGHGNTAGLTDPDLQLLVSYVGSLDGSDKQYMRIHNGDGHCLVARGANEGANIEHWYCGSYDDQFWYQDAQGRLHTKLNEGYCATGQPWNNGWFYLTRCSDSSYQKWEFNGSQLRLKEHPQYVADDYKGGVWQVGMWQASGSANQRWYVNNTDFVQLRNGAYGCLTATGTASNSNVVVSTCRNLASQKWWGDGSGRFHLQSNPNVCLDYKGETWNGGGVVVWECNDHENQRFNKVDNTLRTRKNTGYAVTASQAADGGNVVVWNANGDASQEWTQE
ncbi:hypothetical protein GCM10023116_34970 [Kistimonas scapharcae]|uniref:PKD domain-containing protein n=1 Tax=Kistimonas scapharcae TaxID=1036133 RepID=A0ABP8V6N5_9GAMM